MKTVCDLVDVVCPAVFTSLDFRNRKVLRYAVAFVCLCHSFQLLEQFYCFYELLFVSYVIAEHLGVTVYTSPRRDVGICRTCEAVKREME